MNKTIKAAKQDRCIGCEMCVMECQRQLKKIGLEGAPIRILRNICTGVEFEVSIDPRLFELNTRKIIDSCPRQVFEKEEGGA